MSNVFFVIAIVAGIVALFMNAPMKSTTCENGIVLKYDQRITTGEALCLELGHTK